MSSKDKKYTDLVVDNNGELLLTPVLDDITNNLISAYERLQSDLLSATTVNSSLLAEPAYGCSYAGIADSTDFLSKTRESLRKDMISYLEKHIQPMVFIKRQQRKIREILKRKPVW